MLHTHQKFGLKRQKSHIIVSAVMAVIFLYCPPRAYSDSESVQSAHTEVQFISEYSTIKPGQSFLVALRMTMQEHWHTYWKNAGDAGLSTDIKWDLPKGYKVDPIIWPYPERIDVAGLTSYGYSDEVHLLSRVYAPDDLKPNSVTELRANLRWLACKIECVPGTADLSFTLSVNEDQSIDNPRWQKITEYFKKRPSNVRSPWKVAITEKPNAFVFKISDPVKHAQQVNKIEFFPERDDVIRHSAQQILRMDRKDYTLSIEKSSLYAPPIDRMQGLIVIDLGDQKLSKKEIVDVDIPFAEIRKGTVSSNQRHRLTSIWTAMMFAFLGGLILNLMPCVLPVLSIKILNLIEHANEKRSETFKHGLLTTFGILFAFWVLAGLLLILKFVGKEVGWGFQFQSPVFLIILTMLFFWLSLSLFGLFDIGLGLTQLQSQSPSARGYRQSFFNGILATIVATPCTAPFMGSALGYALVRPPVYSFVVFTSLGLGMAFPYLMLSQFPQTLRFLPKPGPWMITLKKVLGLFLLLTTVWLVWILSTQKGSTAVITMCIGLFILTIAAWTLKSKTSLSHTRKEKWRLRFIILILFGLAYLVSMQGIRLSSLKADHKTSTSELNWQKYSPRLIKDLRAQKKIIFLDFTATWCVMCKVNEKVALDNKKVINKFKELDVVMVKADWTSYDEEVTKALEGYGKTSIPFYVLYPKEGEAVFLPEIITPSIVLKALEEI